MNEPIGIVLQEFPPIVLPKIILSGTSVPIKFFFVLSLGDKTSCLVIEVIKLLVLMRVCIKLN